MRTRAGLWTHQKARPESGVVAVVEADKNLDDGERQQKDPEHEKYHAHQQRRRALALPSALLRKADVVVVTDRVGPIRVVVLLRRRSAVVVPPRRRHAAALVGAVAGALDGVGAGPGRPVRVRFVGSPAAVALRVVAAVVVVAPRRAAAPRRRAALRVRAAALVEDAARAVVVDVRVAVAVLVHR